MRKTAFLTAVAMAASLVVAPSVASAGDNGNGFYNVVVGPGTDESSATITWDETHLLPTGVDFNGDSKKDFSSKRLGSSTLSNRCLLYTSPSPRDRTRSRMPSSA